MTDLHRVIVALAALTARTASRTGRRARDAGASALEFAIIAAIVVIAASVIGGVIYKIVSDKSIKLEQCANQPIGAPACAP